MRVDSITMSWFRGAADAISLDCGLKSLVIYGPNSAGKSSFVDAIEYAINGGKIGHLAHEYSGTKQEKAVPNTHKPQDRKTSISFKFKNGVECSIAIGQNGAHTRSGTADITTWDYRRTVLRQDEIARFIHSSKGTKYSDLLPLLGLGELEIAANNMRQLAKAIEQHSALKEKRGAASQVALKRNQFFGHATDDDIEAKVTAVHKKYCPSSVAADVIAQCDEAVEALTARIKQLSADNARHLALRDLANVKLAAVIKSIRDADAHLVHSVEPVISEKLQVLEAAHAYGLKLETEGSVACPACGQSISKETFKEHIKAEQERLTEIDAIFKARRAAVSLLIDGIKSLKTSVTKKDLSDWIKTQKDRIPKRPFSLA